MADVKLKLLADSFRLYKYDDDGNIDRKRGFRRVRKGEEFTVPDYVAERLTGDSASIVSPYGTTRRTAVKASEHDEDEEEVHVNEQASPFPEADFGSTNIAGTLTSDPENKLREQREEARQAERSPKKQEEVRSARERAAAQHNKQEQASRPAPSHQKSEG